MSRYGAPDDGLRDYDYEVLDAEKELKSYARCIRKFRAAPSFETVEALCLASRRLRYAVREEGSAFGGEASHNHVRRAVELFSEALLLRDIALSATNPRQHSKVRRFFTNIAKRRDDLSCSKA